MKVKIVTDEMVTLSERNCVISGILFIASSLGVSLRLTIPSAKEFQESFEKYLVVDQASGNDIYDGRIMAVLTKIGGLSVSIIGRETRYVQLPDNNEPCEQIKLIGLGSKGFGAAQLFIGNAKKELISVGGEQYWHEYLKFLAAHEFGHVLGMDHHGRVRPCIMSDIIAHNDKQLIQRFSQNPSLKLCWFCRVKGYFYAHFGQLHQ